MNQRVAIWIFSLFSFVAFSLASIGGFLYIFMGHEVLAQIYRQEATAAFSSLHLSNAIPLSSQLERADWFTVGAVLLLFSAWLLLAVSLFPRHFASLGNWLKAYRSYAFAAGLVVLVFALFLPAFSAFLLIRLFLIWLSLALMMMLVPAVQSPKAAGEGAAAGLLVTLAGYVLYVFVGSDASLQFVFAEDSFFENLQVLLLIAAGILSLILFFRPKTPDRNSFYLLFSIVFLFFALEELSWGQRIFGYETPFFMNNADNDAVFYKALGTSADMLLNLGVLLWGIVLPLLHAFVPGMRRFFSRIDFPIVPWTVLAAIALGLGIYLIDPANSVVNEIRESFFALGFIFFALDMFLRSKQVVNKNPVYQHASIDLA